MSELDLDESIRRWRERIARHAAELPATQDAPFGDRRSWSIQLSDRVFAEGGLPPAAGVAVADYRASRHLRVRGYRPAIMGNLGAYVRLHGGGWSFGSIDEQINRSFCSHRARDAGMAVFDVDYRLAPEHPFPAALDDAVAAVNWLVAGSRDLGIDPALIVVGGESAGANIAAGLAVRLRDEGGPRLRGLLLEVGAYDLRVTDLPPSTLAENGLEEYSTLRSNYLGDADPSHPYVSPIASADLSGLPPTHLMTAEHDPLTAGAEAFLERLRSAGVEATGSRRLGQVHASHGLTADYLPARLWHCEVVEVLRAFSSGKSE